MSDKLDEHKVERFLSRADELERKGDIDDAVRYYTAALYLDQENNFIRRRLRELKRISFIEFFPHAIALVDDVSYDGKYLPLIFRNNRELIVLDIETGTVVIQKNNVHGETCLLLILSGMKLCNSTVQSIEIIMTKRSHSHLSKIRHPITKLKMLFSHPMTIHHDYTPLDTHFYAQ